MKHRMRYAYRDLGEQKAGSTVVVNMRGSQGNLILLDPQNFFRYRMGQRFEYAGGRFRRSPARVRIPKDGHWYAVLDLGGHGGRVRGALSVFGPDGSRAELSSKGAPEHASAA
jgi:hypothetical protein